MKLKFCIFLDSQIFCDTETCELKTCEIGFKLLKEENSEEDQCCPTEYCVPMTSSCEVVVKPSCGPYQKVSLVPGTENCPKFVCGKMSINLSYHLIKSKT